MEVWNLKTPQRVKIFIWLALKNKMHTIDNLVNKGWALPNMCCLCRQQAESVEHMFATCCFTSTVRQLTMIAMHNDPPDTFIRDQYEKTITGEGGPLWKLTQAAVCFNVWKERCRRIFADQQLHTEDVTTVIVEDIRSWKRFYMLHTTL
jgi:zinc-binding in reverse transcriptase